MYTFITAFVRSGETHNRWIETDIGDLVLELVCKRYRDIVVVLDHTLISGERTMMFDDVWERVSGSSLTFNEWLVANGLNTLPTVDGKPSIETQSVYSTTASKAWVKGTITDGTQSVDTPITLDMRHLYLTSDEVSGMELYRNCLVSVNGYLHATDSDGIGLLVKDAVTTRNIAGSSAIGLHSFEHIGELEFLPITKEMIRPIVEGGRLRDRLVIDIDRDLTEYSLAISIGGYFHIDDNQFMRRSNERSLSLLWEHQPWLHRYFESKQRIDMSSFVLSESSRNDELINVAELYSDENIINWLTLSQSFLILIKTDGITTYTQPIELNPGVNQYIGRTEPTAMMFVGYGRISEYFPQDRNGLWVINAYDGVKDNYLFDYTDRNSLDNVDDMGVSGFPSRPDYKGPAQFLHIENTILQMPKPQTL